MTALEMAMNVEDAVSVATTAARTLGIEQASRELFISEEDLLQLEAGRIDAVGLGPTLVDRIAAWARIHSVELFRAAGRPIPPFNHFADYWENFYDGPREGRRAHVERQRLTRKFLDFELAFPFGVPASALTPHSGFVDYFARRAFDLLTYKTVRDRPWHAHPFPQWAFAVDLPDTPTEASKRKPVIASLDPGLRRQDLINSCGVPSLKPTEWQADVEATKRMLSFGQVLIVSVMGSPEVATSDAEVVQQFANAASLAVEAGADIVETNLSCPNTGGKSVICRSADLSEEILRAVSARLGKSRTPLLAKISYLEPNLLEEFVMGCAKYLQGIVGINTLSVPAVTTAGEPFFGARVKAGLSGPNIRSFGLDVTRRLVELRDRGFDSSDWVVIGVGGVTTPSDFDLYMDAGADAVQSCSGAWLNPNLAVEIQERDIRSGIRFSAGKEIDPRDVVRSSVAIEDSRIETPSGSPLRPPNPDGETVPVAAQFAVLESLEKRGPSDVIDLAVASRLSPSQAGGVLEVLLGKGWVGRGQRMIVRLTPEGKKALEVRRRTGASPISSARSSMTADDALDRALLTLEQHG